MSLEDVTNEMPGKLYVFLPEKVEKFGACPGGWDPEDRVVPAFNPFEIPVAKAEQFYGKGRQLYQIEKKYVPWFFGRRTGPQNVCQGIFGCPAYLPPEAFTRVDRLTAENN